jgi:hypothetical protein
MGEEKNLLDPLNNELIPTDSPAELPNELCPGYEESKSAALDGLEDALRTSTADPCGFDDGLSLRRGEGGGLRVYRNDLPVRDISGLEPAELQTVKKYVEGSR